MFRKLGIVAVLSLGLILNGCSKQTEVGTGVETDLENQVETEIKNEEKHEIEEKEDIDYSRYLGSWDIDVDNMYTFTAFEIVFGRSAIDIFEVDGNKISGTIVAISSAPSFRIAEVEFEGEIIDDKLTARYEDESWEYSGTINLEFKEDHIIANVSKDEIAEDSFVGWGIIEGEYKFVRPVATEIVELNEEISEEIEAMVLTLEDSYPELQMLLKATEEENIYYAYVDCKANNQAEDSDTIGQYLLKLEKNNEYIILETIIMEYPLEFDLIREFLDM